MTKTTPPGASPKTGESREDRLKAALKANMARRKAQSRARAGKAGKPGDGKAAGPARGAGGDKGQG